MLIKLCIIAPSVSRNYKKMKLSGSYSKKIVLVAGLVLLSLPSLLLARPADMRNYCVVPPFAGTPVAPNVLLLMDYSSSMQFPVYIDCSRGDISNFGDTWQDTDGQDASNCDRWASDQKGNSGQGQSAKGYNPNTSYYGYFETNTCYGVSSGRFEPSSCSCSNKIGSGNCISGNLLNWITTTRIDVARKVLVGGKTSTGGGSTFLESTGAYYTFFDGSLGCNLSVTTNGPDNRTLTIKSKVCSNNHTRTCAQNSDCGSGNQCQDKTCPFGDGTNFNNVTIKARVSDPSAITGVLDDIWDKVHLELMSFGSDGSDYGTVRASKDDSKAGLFAAVETVSPKGSTPTGKALWEAYDYYKQDNDHSYAANTNDIRKGDAKKDPLWDGPSLPVPCRRSFVLLLSDGAWKQEVDPVIPAKALTSLKRTDFTNVTPVFTYTVFAWGDLDSETPGSQGRRSMISTAIFGGFEDHNGDKWPYPFVSINPSGTGECSSQGDVRSDITDKFGKTYCNSRNLPALTDPPYPLAYCNPSGTWDMECSEWDLDKTGLPYNFFEANDGAALKTAILNAIYDMLARASAGSAASVIASGEGSGANLIQGAFYPKRKFSNSLVSWTGSLKSLWYYIDPFLNNSTIREDSYSDNKLDISTSATADNIIKFRYDSSVQNTVADICSDPSCTAITRTKPFESVVNLWETGELLWQQGESSRKIFTTLDGSSLTEFKTGLNDPTLMTDLQATEQNVADRIISYVRGSDYNTKVCSKSITTHCDTDRNCPSGETCRIASYCSNSITTRCAADTDCPSDQTCGFQYRNRTVSIDLNHNGKIDTGETNVWKLGDILDSTPKVASWVPLNAYHRVYSDTTYGPSQDPFLESAADSGRFISSADYKGRGIVFAGANDGMLHAFRLGTIKLHWGGQGNDQKAWLTNTDVGLPSLGREMWAFIPKNVLPYLRYLADANYCHIYSVDLTPFLFDASIGAPVSGDISNDPGAASNWRTILIGGMRLGGACRNSGSSCTDCVQTPIPDVGYSSYFALDVTDYLAHQTDPANHQPRILWEFSDPALGFSTSGPALVRVGDRTRNGSWYVVLGSGPTGPISTSDQQFQGRSDQTLKIFVLNLKDGNRAVSPYIDTGITDAFAGSLFNATNDTDLNYQDDVVYVPYLRKDAAAGTWTQGGVGRLLTKESKPSGWDWSVVIENTGPVTSAPGRLETKDKDKLWLFFGTGRYYFKTGTSVDDETGPRSIVGIKDLCFSSAGFSSPCPDPISGIGSLIPATLSPPDNEPATGWHIDLDSSGEFIYCEGGNGRCNPPDSGGTGASVKKQYGAERVITDTLATTTGVVYFTSFKPYTGICNAGGKSFVWAVKYNTGGAATSLLKGKAFVQLSTGSIEHLDLSKAFTDAGNRRSAVMEGVPPASQGLSVLSAPPPVKRVLHIRER